MLFQSDRTSHFISLINLSKSLHSPNIKIMIMIFHTQYCILYIHTHTYTHTHARTRTRTHTHTHTHIVCMYIYIYTHTHVHTYTHTYVHTVYCKSFEAEKFRGFRGLIGDRETFPAKLFRSREYHG